MKKKGEIMGDYICLFIIVTIIFMALGFWFAYWLSDENPGIGLIFAIIFGFLSCVCFINTENSEYETTTDKIQDVNTQNINIYINGEKVTVQEEIVNSQDNSYSISINGTTINPQSINLNNCDFSVDTEAHRIAITEKGTEIGIEDTKPYEIHINGSDINIESLNLNDFAITVDEGNQWIVLTKK